jgi:hypothetical protein
MPTTPSRARRWIQDRKATPFWKKGVFCVRLNVDPSDDQKQDIAVGIDPGSKKEGFTVKSKAHTYLNIQADAVTWVKDAVETRRMMRRNRRSRKTPCRQNRLNRRRGGLAPSTRARWGWKLRLATWLSHLFPITVFVVEDIKAVSKEGQRRWNQSFSPLQVGKKWFYSELEKLASVVLREGWETARLREEWGLKKTGKKLASVFEAHCVDSWVLASSHVGGHCVPNRRLMCLSPLRLHRRQLHVTCPCVGGRRKTYGSTRSEGLKRGSIVKHPKWGLAYVGGASKGQITLHSIATGIRLSTHVNARDCRFLTYSGYRESNV